MKVKVKILGSGKIFKKRNVKNYPFCVRKKMLYTCSYYKIAGVNLYLTIFSNV